MDEPLTLPHSFLSLCRRLALKHRPVTHNWAVDCIRLCRVCTPEPYTYDRPQPKAAAAAAAASASPPNRPASHVSVFHAEPEL